MNLTEARAVIRGPERALALIDEARRRIAAL